MKVYQNNELLVNNALQLINPKSLMAKASEGLLALSVELGLEVLHQMMEREVVEHVVAKGAHKTDREAYRHGTEKTAVIMGGGKVPTKRPRVRSKDNKEIELRTLKKFQVEEQLNSVVLSRVLAGVSCRKYSRTLDGMPEETKCTSKSDVSRRFAAGMKSAMDEFFGRPINGSFPAVMIDGMVLGKMTIIVALGIRSDGKKQILGIIEGGSENSDVVKAMFTDLIDLGLDTKEPRLYTLDGSKALAKAVRDTFGDKAAIQRCQVHKKRNVLSQLPESEKADISIMMTAAYREFDHKEALSRLERIAKRLEYRYPAAAASLREGLDETLTVHRLGVPGLLRQQCHQLKDIPWNRTKHCVIICTYCELTNRHCHNN